MGINHITNVRADGDDMTIGFLGARPYEKSSLEAEPSIPAYPNMNEADRANDRAKSDGDVIMADTQSSNQGVLESETRRTPGQAVKVTALEEGGTSSSRISAPVVGEKGTIKQETFNVRWMDDILHASELDATSVANVWTPHNGGSAFTALAVHQRCDLVRAGAWIEPARLDAPGLQELRCETA